MWHTADDRPIRRIDLPVAEPGRSPAGSILFMPGRGDFYEKYLETLDHWHTLGWHVTASDWRGQAGSGRLGNDAVTGHIDDFAIWIDDLGTFWDQWIASTPAPHVLAGHSMGGHLVLRAVADGSVSPDGLVLSAPMLGFIGPLPVALMHAVARLMAGLGDARRPAWKWSEKPGEVPQGRESLLTHDPARYADEMWWRDRRPELVMGPGSWGWVERGYASMRRLYAPGVLESIGVPTLIVATSADKLVSFAAIEAAAARLPNCQLVAFGDEAAHEVLREADPVRDKAIAAIDSFLSRIATGT